MSSPCDDDGLDASDHVLPRRHKGLEVVFEAFHDEHYPVWFGYAYLHTGTRAAARAVCHDLSRCLAASWPLVLESSPANYAWKLLKEILAVRLIERTESVLIETAAFHAALEHQSSDREQLRLMEQALCLYWGISRLPERQRDLLLLHYTLGRSVSVIAALFGETEAVIGVQLEAAAGRLTALLGTVPRNSELGE